MTISATVRALPTPPSTGNSATFAALADAMMNALPGFQGDVNAVCAAINAELANINAISAISVPYTFDANNTADADPGAGTIRLSNATQNLATVLRADVLDRFGVNVQALLDTFGGSTSTSKGYLILASAADPSGRQIRFNVTGLASPAGYRNITVAALSSTAASPFANGEQVLLVFLRNGDNGLAADLQGQVPNSFTTAGTGAAYTGAPTPAVSAYAANQSFFVTFHAAAQDNATLQINGIAAPPNLVVQQADGSYRNARAGDWPANHRSRVTGLAANQYLVEEVPAPDGATSFPVVNFSADFGITMQHRGALCVHPATDNVTARTITIPANAANALPVGFTFTVANENGASGVNVAITTDTIYHAGLGVTGTRAVPAGGMTSFIKITATKWMATGN